MLDLDNFARISTSTTSGIFSNRRITISGSTVNCTVSGKPAQTVIHGAVVTNVFGHSNTQFRKMSAGMSGKTLEQPWKAASGWAA